MDTTYNWRGKVTKKPLPCQCPFVGGLPAPFASRGRFTHPGSLVFLFFPFFLSFLLHPLKISSISCMVSSPATFITTLVFLKH